MNTFDEIIQTKAYSDLSSSELEIIREMVSSEEEYNEMKSFYAGIGQLALSGMEEVSPSVKASLNTVFQAKHPGISQNWNAPAEEIEKKIVPLYNRNLFRVAALLVLSAGVITVWVSMSDNQLTQSEQKQALASSDSLPQEKQKETAKKEFPLNEQTHKEFTASSSIPADENVQQKTTIYSNAVPNEKWINRTSDSKDQSILPSTPGTYQVSPSSVSGSTTTFSFSSGRATKQNNWAEIQKEEDKKGDFAKVGLDADLNPGGLYGEMTKDYKPSIKTSDYLSLIEPSF
jgi:hypothetical protein